jgi:ATP-dependent RNA helicase DeaD
VSHVINFDPADGAPKSTCIASAAPAASAAEGVAITLCSPREQRFLQYVERLTKQKIEIGKLPSEAICASASSKPPKNPLRERIRPAGLEASASWSRSWLKSSIFSTVAAAAPGARERRHGPSCHGRRLEPVEQPRGRDSIAPASAERPQRDRDQDGPMTLLRISVGKE